MVTRRGRCERNLTEDPRDFNLYPATIAACSGHDAGLASRVSLRRRNPRWLNVRVQDELLDIPPTHRAPAGNPGHHRFTRRLAGCTEQS
jgi:hypothetical protein